MSGPIVRKYGFPNFEQIFGKRELQHGVEDEPAPEGERGAPTSEEPAIDDPAKRVIPGEEMPATRFGNAVE